MVSWSSFIVLAFPQRIFSCFCCVSEVPVSFCETLHDRPSDFSWDNFFRVEEELEKETGESIKMLYTYCFSWGLNGFIAAALLGNSPRLFLIITGCILTGLIIFGLIIFFSAMSRPGKATPENISKIRAAAWKGVFLTFEGYLWRKYFILDEICLNMLGWQDVLFYHYHEGWAIKQARWYRNLEHSDLFANLACF